LNYTANNPSIALCKVHMLQYDFQIVALRHFQSVAFDVYRVSLLIFLNLLQRFRLSNSCFKIGHFHLVASYFHFVAIDNSKCCSSLSKCCFI